MAVLGAVIINWPILIVSVVVAGAALVGLAWPYLPKLKKAFPLEAVLADEEDFQLHADALVLAYAVALEDNERLKKEIAQLREGVAKLAVMGGE